MKLSDVRLFLLDMDGTFYLGNRLLPGARDFLHVCDTLGIRYLFLTNNSSKRGADYIEKLARLGIRISSDKILTSGDATLLWMNQQHFKKEILLVGTPSLEQQFLDDGYVIRAKTPQAAVLGFDTTLTYDKLVALCNAVRASVPYVATHPDINCPIEGGYLPDIGATIAFVNASTGRLPDFIIGKPGETMAKIAAERTGIPLPSICMVGDRLYTDIAMGSCGISTALVLSGETTREMLKDTNFSPNFVFSGLAEMASALKGGI